ncbi:hypothetical protein [Mucilaginibacter polytrichastri]|uniref:DUF1440 domain-containing protein n=1 Tax=Mucilaginibacter polytrichastri TaxID=1302689 RepID=A0A1Q6A0T6_9SPHI|nr:hypothetical protein [Mucilaginibacter polytrichastri]OKS87630.1 hypothetical protein RG47T_3091 [Mucilaginibacter polytrichastri]SFS93050.1 hypothetical protein SAMN04487890_106222 [Mucilaginibacter polytrichastri]
MNFKKIFAAGTAGTAVMTLFSYAVTKAAKSNYLEPSILGQLLNRVTPLEKQTAMVTGWASHLGIGILFTGAYDKYLQLKKTRPTLANALLMGSLGGLTGIAIWQATFKAHPNPPGVNLKNFYKQLFIAHLIFGAAVALTYEADDMEIVNPDPFYQETDYIFI